MTNLLWVSYYSSHEGKTSIYLAKVQLPSSVCDIGSRRELFVDDFLIETIKGAELKMHRPVPRDVAIVCDAPWEGNTSAYYTIFADGDRFRMYYRGAHFDEKTKNSAHPEFTCYAESRDGIRVAEAQAWPVRVQRIEGKQYRLGRRRHAQFHAIQGRQS